MRLLTSSFLALCLFSCQPNLDWEGVVLKDYVFQIDDYETPKVLVHDRDSLGFARKNYWVIEKLNDNQLLLTEYNHNFEPITFLVDEYREDGVYSLKYGFTVAWDTIDVDINQAGPIFPFIEPDSKFGSGGSFRLEPDAKSKVVFENELRFVEITFKEFNGEMLSTLIAKGTSEHVMDYYDQQFEMSNDSLEIWYTKGIGITKFAVQSSEGLIEDVYVEAISVEEFEVLKQERLASLNSDIEPDEWGYVHLNKQALPGMLKNICSSEASEFDDLYPILDSIASDKYERLVLVDSLKSMGFDLVDWGRGNWQSGPRIVSRRLKKGECECEVDKLYYATGTERKWRVTERIKCMQGINRP